MGAALVLDSPGTEYLRSHLDAIRIVSGRTFPEMDVESAQRAADEFEERCHRRCLELAEQATKLDPQKVDWWRLRAALLFPAGRAAPRDPRWLVLLDDFQTHDPDNALYDYLAAKQLWNQSTKWVRGDPDIQLEILDDEACQEGVYRFNRAQSKPFLALGDVGFTVTADLLKLARIAAQDHPNIVNGCLVHFRRSLVIHDLWRWQFWRAGQEVERGDIGAAVAGKREGLRLIAQHTAAGNSTANDSQMSELKVMTAKWLKKLAVEHPQAVSPSEIEEFDANLKRALIEQMSLRRAAQTLPQNQPKPKRDQSVLGVAISFGELFLAFAPQLIVVLFLIGIAGTIALRWLPTPGVSVGPLGQSCAFLCAATLTIVLFALGPGGIISREAQEWIVTTLILLIPTALSAWFGWRAFQRRRYQFSLRVFLIASFVLPLMCAAAAAVLESLPFGFSIGPYARGSIDAERLGQWFSAQGARAWWAAGQWTAYHGHLWTAAIWVCLVALLYQWKVLSLARRDPPQKAASLRNRAVGLVASISYPALAMSGFLLALYLVVEPRALKELDRRYQQEMAFARNPDAFWQMVETAVQAVRSNQAGMAEIEARAAAEVDQGAPPTLK
jgi:hypothetical protein